MNFIITCIAWIIPYKPEDSFIVLIVYYIACTFQLLVNKVIKLFHIVSHESQILCVKHIRYCIRISLGRCVAHLHWILWHVIYTVLWNKQENVTWYNKNVGTWRRLTQHCPYYLQSVTFQKWMYESKTYGYPEVCCIFKLNKFR